MIVINTLDRRTVASLEPTSIMRTSSQAKSAGQSTSIGYDISICACTVESSFVTLVRTTVRSAKIAFKKVTKSVSKLLFAAKWDATSN